MSRNENVWEYYGENDAYFGVNSLPEMRGDQLNAAARSKFFESGESYVARIWNQIEESFGTPFNPLRSLDFGSGVGRVALPIARRSGEVVGVDISTAMIEEAKKNAEELSIDNITFLKGDDDLSRLSGEFDFIHSFVVFQHIEPKRGMKILAKLVQHLSKDGIGALQFQYENSYATGAQKIRYRLYRDVPGVYALRNIVLRKKNEPLIPMYPYDLNKIMLFLQKNGCHRCVVKFSDHSVEGALIFFQKTTDELF